MDGDRTDTTVVGQAEKANHCCSDRITAESLDLSMSHVQGTCSVVGTRLVEVMHVCRPLRGPSKGGGIYHLGPKTTIVGNSIPECKLATYARSNAGYNTSRPSAYNMCQCSGVNHVPIVSCVALLGMGIEKRHANSSDRETILDGGKLSYLGNTPRTLKFFPFPWELYGNNSLDIICVSVS